MGSHCSLLIHSLLSKTCLVFGFSVSFVLGVLFYSVFIILNFSAIEARLQIFYGILWFSSRDEMNIIDLCQAFFDVTGRDIPYSEYGFNDVLSFLESDHFSSHFTISCWRTITIRRRNCTCRAFPQEPMGDDLDQFDWN